MGTNVLIIAVTRIGRPVSTTNDDVGLEGVAGAERSGVARAAESIGRCVTERSLVKS